jgi:hypothetical protein
MTSSHRLEVLGGAGTVSRDGAVVAWFAPGYPAAIASDVLELARSATAGMDAAGFAEVLQDVASTSSFAFGVVVESDGLHIVVVKGHVVVSEDGLERLRGTAADALVAEDVVAIGSLTIRGDSDPGQLDRPGSLPFDLREGTVPGGGLTLWPSARPQPAASPELDDSVVLFDLSVPAEPRDPLPIAPPSLPIATPAVSAIPPPASPAELIGPELAAPGAVPEDPASHISVVTAAVEPNVAPRSTDGAPLQVISAHQDVVRGISCARGHFNNPRALYCGICGLAMVQNSVILVDGPRPPLGVLLSDDGTAYSLDGDYILGRAPELADDVKAGRARPLKVDDGTGKVSRVHARVTLDEWEVVVTDLGSHNGTSVFNPGETNWRTLRAEEPLVLQPGGRLVIGQSTFEFQSIQRR